jgi:TDG/mug DNA glycosylase family protein
MLSDPAISWGQQPAPFAGAQAWVLPNPSGLNRTFGLDALVAAYSDMRLVLAANPKSV